MDGTPLARDINTRRRDEVREVCLSVVAAMIAVALIGMLMPPTIRVVALAALMDETDYRRILDPILLAAIATLALAMLISTWLIERRLPWPFSPVVPGPRWRERTLVNGMSYLAAWATFLLTIDTWPGTRLYVLSGDRFLWVAIPAEMAARIIAVGAAYAVGGVLAHLVLGRFRTRRLATAAAPAHI
jgi:hypothetical protein